MAAGRIACENGEELRLTRLAEDLDARIAKLRTRFGDIGETPVHNHGSTWIGR
jgi:cell division protein ZapA (FtsZ GTPase activity inhibitor)